MFRAEHFFIWKQSMKNLQHIRTRRQLFRIMAASAASIPFLVLARKSASADIGPFLELARDSASGDIGPVLELEKSASALISPCLTSTCRCLLKGTKISTPSGDRLVQELQIGDEVQTLAGPKVIKWIGYNKF